MPYYQYRCEQGCPEFDVFRMSESRDVAAPCPHCGSVAKRVTQYGKVLAHVSSAFTRFANIDKTALKAQMGSGPWEEVARPRWNKFVRKRGEKKAKPTVFHR